jgi:predicted dehydrogenase
MHSRRNFIEKVATGLAGTAATIAAPSVLGANSRIRLGIIGNGDRGQQILREALVFPNVECVAAADVYTRRLDELKAIAPNAKAYSDYRALLDDRSIDAVLIATPQHLHSEQFIAALDAGKHVYQEKTMAFTLEQAKAMRSALERAKGRTVQIGHQWTSWGHFADAVSFSTPDLLGKVTSIQAHMFRNTPHGKPQWTRQLYPDMTPASIDWNAFLGEAPQQDFDANRFHNWRLFWDYSGGNVFENMSQQLAFWYKALNLEIPYAVSMTGGLFLWKDGREVPDTMNVSMEHAEELMFNWSSGFGNDKLNVTEEVLGDRGTITHTQQSIRYSPQKVNRRDGNEMAGMSPNQRGAHMQNFLDHIRGAAKNLACPFDLGYRVSVTCRMAVESYRQQRTVYWDAAQEQIV